MSKPKKYLVFAGDNYYPSGGWGDLVMKTNNLRKAVAAAQYLRKQGGYDWAYWQDTSESPGQSMPDGWAAHWDTLK